MCPERHASRDLDELIAEITVDCNGDDEAAVGFECAFDEGVRFPVAGTVIGVGVQVVSVGRGDGRRELIATCTHAGGRYQVALLDVDVLDADSSRLVAAYRRWLGP